MEITDLFFYINSQQHNEKIVIGPSDDNKHITIHLGTKSKIFDIHTTSDSEIKDHKTLLRLKYSTLAKLLESIIPELPSFFIKYFASINLGKIKRYKFYIMPLNLKYFESMIKINSNQHRINFKGVAKLNPESLIIDYKALPYTTDHCMLFDFKKDRMFIAGMIFKIPGKARNTRFGFLSFRKVNKMRIELINLLVARLKDIDHEDYESAKSFLKIHRI